MVKLTIVGRARDGLPLAQGHRYPNLHNSILANYKQRGEFILAELSRGVLASPELTVLIENNHCFHFLVEEGICFITLCDSYPKKLAFRYLLDLQIEFQKFDRALVVKVTRPYSFIKFDGMIASYMKQYIDTRTQTNLHKLNAVREKDLYIMTVHISEILRRRRNSAESTLAPRQIASPIWGSQRLEVIAMKWMPIALIIGVATVLLWASFTLTESLVI